MKILFIAKHGPIDNQDEDAVTYALTQLEHEVVCVEENPRRRKESEKELESIALTCDFALGFKCPTISLLGNLPCPKVIWYFDKVGDGGDTSLTPRSKSRIAWFRDMLPYCRIAFITDGDFVASNPWDYTRKGVIKQLMQGTDERFIGFGQYPKDSIEQPPEIVFAGMVNHGQDRAAHIRHLQGRWNSHFGILGDGGLGRRIHGRQLADYFSATKIVVSPQGPNTDRYWSNRVYLTTGLGGFLLHPYCDGLVDHYTPNKDLIYYHDWKELDDLIVYYLNNDTAREEMRQAGYERTIKDHLYRHRCQTLIKLVEEVL